MIELKEQKQFAQISSQETLDIYLLIETDTASPDSQSALMPTGNDTPLLRNIDHLINTSKTGREISALWTNMTLHSSSRSSAAGTSAPLTSKI